MSSTDSVKPSGRKKKSHPPLTAEEQKKLEERSHQLREQRAETQMDLAKLFVSRQMHDIARRRLQEIIAEYAGSAAAQAAQKLLKKLSAKS